MTDTDLALLFGHCVAAATAGALGRIGRRLFGEEAEVPPDDPSARASWRMKRRWVAIGDLAPLPGFAAAGTFAVDAWGLSPAAAELGCVAAGALGVAYVIDKIRMLIDQRAGKTEAKVWRRI